MVLTKEKEAQNPLGFSQDGIPIYGYHPIKTYIPICNTPIETINPQTGLVVIEYCQSTKLGSTGRCNSHSRNNDPDENPKYSKVLKVKKHLFNSYKSFLERPDITSLKNEIALTDLRIENLLSQLTKDEPSVNANPSTHASKYDYEVYDSIVKNIIRFGNQKDLTGDEREFSSTEKFEVLRDLSFALIDYLQKSANESIVYDKLQVTYEFRRKLAETEHKKQISANQFLTAEQALVLMHIVIATIKKYVHDAAVHAAIADDINKALPYYGVETKATEAIDSVEYTIETLPTNLAEAKKHSLVDSKELKSNSVVLRKKFKKLKRRVVSTNTLKEDEKIAEYYATKV